MNFQVSGLLDLQTGGIIKSEVNRLRLGSRADHEVKLQFACIFVVCDVNSWIDVFISDSPIHWNVAPPFEGIGAYKIVDCCAELLLSCWNCVAIPANHDHTNTGIPVRESCASRSDQDRIRPGICDEVLAVWLKGKLASGYAGAGSINPIGESYGRQEENPTGNHRNQ